MSCAKAGGKVRDPREAPQGEALQTEDALVHAATQWLRSHPTEEWTNDCVELTALVNRLTSRIPEARRGGVIPRVWVRYNNHIHHGKRIKHIKAWMLTAIGHADEEERVYQEGRSKYYKWQALKQVKGRKKQVENELAALGENTPLVTATGLWHKEKAHDFSLVIEALIKKAILAGCILWTKDISPFPDICKSGWEQTAFDEFKRQREFWKYIFNDEELSYFDTHYPVCTQCQEFVARACKNQKVQVALTIALFSPSFEESARNIEQFKVPKKYRTRPTRSEVSPNL